MKRKKIGMAISVIVTVVAVFVGVGVIKTVVECALYTLPLGVKFAKNLVAFAMDAIVMCIGIPFAKKLAERFQLIV